MKDTLILSGGGLLGVCTLGALDVMFEEYNQNQFTRIAGSSAGALIATMLCIKNPRELFEIMKNVNLFDDSNVDFTEFLELKGFMKHEIILDILSDYISQACTFQEFYKLTKKHLLVVGTNLTLQTKEYFDYQKTPNMSVLEAVCISISVPFVFHQRLYKGSIYTDGCVTESFPWNAFCAQEHKKLGIILQSFSKKSEEIDFLQYIESMINTLFKKNCTDNSNNVLTIRVEFPMMKEYSSQDLEWLYIHGQTSAKSWIKKLK